MDIELEVSARPPGNAVHFAQIELGRYWQAVTTFNEHNIALAVEPSHFESDQLDPQWDDAYSISVERGMGFIIGVNERSVLLGVYRFLTGIGCRFFRPTAEGEYIPVKSVDQCSFSLRAAASNRHRGICIEGAVSLENVIDMIDWAPKAGFNCYFIQFRDSFTFFERWYTHEGNDLLRKEPFTSEQAALYVELIEKEIHKRGMIYHGVGHGWTCESIGFPSTGWHKIEDSQIPDDKRGLLAEIDGKRSFFEGIPLNTQLCYSNPEVAELLVNEIVTFVAQHREVDVLHFWLADNFNNFCECESCRQSSPPDQYVRLLNEIDSRMSALGLDNKIAFLIYLELLWTPEKEKINNPDRYIMMYAPIHRTYTKAFLSEGTAPDRSRVTRIPYVRNKVKYPSDIEGNLAFLYEWQREFAGDSFDFDYHLMWDINREYTGISLARIIYEDMKGLSQLGLNGLISCQLQRSFFPNGLCMYTMGQTLFDTSIEFDAIVDDYFEAAYGEHKDLALQYLNRLSKLFSHEYIRNEIPMLNEGVSRNYREAVQWINDWLPRIEAAAHQSADANQGTMLRILARAAQISKGMAAILADKSAGMPAEELKPRWKELKHFIDSHELELQAVLDVYYFNMMAEGIVSAEW